MRSDKEIQEQELEFSLIVKELVRDIQETELKNSDQLKELQELKSSQDCDIVSIDIVEHDNKYLHGLLNDLSQEYRNDTSARGEAHEQAMQRNFDYRMSMEKLLREEIKNLDHDFKTKEMESVGLEADLAGEENAQLLVEVREGLQT